MFPYDMSSLSYKKYSFHYYLTLLRVNLGCLTLDEIRVSVDKIQDQKKKKTANDRQLVKINKKDALSLYLCLPCSLSELCVCLCVVHRKSRPMCVALLARRLCRAKGRQRYGAVFITSTIQAIALK